VTIGEIIERNGGVEALLAKWLNTRSFPWHPDGFPQRAERREFRQNGIRWPELDEDKDNEDVIEAHRSAYALAHEKLDSECRRYARICDADDQDVFEHLPHDEFCDTAYWLGLAAWMKRAAGMQCFDCYGRFSKLGQLEVHHKTYQNRGREWPDHLKDLVVLCGACHGNRHGKKRRK